MLARTWRYFIVSKHFLSLVIVLALPGGELSVHLHEKEVKNASIKHMKACSAAKRVPGLSVAERFSPVARVVICWPVAFAAWASHSPGVVPFQNQVGRTACG